MSLFVTDCEGTLFYSTICLAAFDQSLFADELAQS